MIANGVEIFDWERLDDLHRNGFMIIQDPKKFCFGMDAVLLTGFASAHQGSRVIDIGTGTGIIPILMAAKTKAAYLAGIEIQEESVAMARRSVKYNGLENRIEIIQGNAEKIEEYIKPHEFDVVLTNPPYMVSGGGKCNLHSAKAIARHEITLSLDGVLRAAAFALKFRGRLFMIHRPFRLTDIICTMRKHNLEPKIIRFVQSHADREPNMVLIEASFQGGPMVKVLNPLIIYNQNGSYTEECYNIYYK